METYTKMADENNPYARVYIKTSNGKGQDIVFIERGDRVYTFVNSSSGKYGALGIGKFEELKDRLEGTIPKEIRKDESDLVSAVDNMIESARNCGVRPSLNVTANIHELVRLLHERRHSAHANA